MSGRFLTKALIALSVVVLLIAVGFATGYVGVRDVPRGTVVWCGSSWGVWER